MAHILLCWTPIVVTREETMRRMITLIALSLMPLPLTAGCFGTQALQTCTDALGNTYTVQRFGGTTYIEGRDADGLTWRQQSVTRGNDILHSGEISDGTHWTATERNLGAGYTRIEGIDTDGSTFLRVCNWLGECE